MECGGSGLTVCGEGNYVWGSQREQGRSPNTLTLPILIEAEMEALGGFEEGRAMPEAPKSPRGVPPTSASAADLRTPSLFGVSFDLNPTNSAFSSKHCLDSALCCPISGVISGSFLSPVWTMGAKCSLLTKVPWLSWREGTLGLLLALNSCTDPPGSFVLLYCRVALTALLTSAFYIFCV